MFKEIAFIKTVTLPNKDITKGIWNEFGKLLKNFILKRIPNKFDADDILQDVFVRIHLNIGQLQNTEKLLPWIFTIARNVIADFYRKSKFDKNIDFSNLINENIYIDDEMKDMCVCLQPFIDTLPEIYKEALISVDLEKMPQLEFAALKGISYSAAKSRVQRAREMLKDSIVNCCKLYTDRYGNIVDYKEKHLVKQDLNGSKKIEKLASFSESFRQ